MVYDTNKPPQTADEQAAAKAAAKEVVNEAAQANQPPQTFPGTYLDIKLAYS